jgi:hypothetical protein
MHKSREEGEICKGRWRMIGCNTYVGGGGGGENDIYQEEEV